MKKRFAGFGRRANSPKEKTKKEEAACGKTVGEESRKAEIPRTEILPAPHINPFSQNYYERGEEIIFTDSETKEQKTIVSKTGCFCNFPGVEDYPDESSEVRGHMADAAKSKEIRFSAYFEPFGKDQYVVWWTIWPDGRYWEDEDGFGGTNDEEIQLYALMDRHGCYTTPFRLRKVGIDYYA